MIDALRQQVVYRHIVQIESGAVDACRFANFFHRNVGEIFRFQELQKRLIHLDGGGKIFTFRFIQEAPPSFPPSTIDIEQNEVNSGF